MVNQDDVVLYRRSENGKGSETGQTNPTEGWFQASLQAKRADVLHVLEEIDAEISEIELEFETKIEGVRGKRKHWEKVLSHIEGLLMLEHSETIGEGEGTSTSGSAEDTSDPLEAVHKILTDLGKPIHYKELARQLANRGIFLPGKDPAASLLTRLSRDQKFKRSPDRGVYGLASWRMRSSKKRKRSSTTRGR